MAADGSKHNSRKPRRRARGIQGNRSDETPLSKIENLLRLLTRKIKSHEARLLRVEAASGVMSSEIIRKTLAQAQRKKPGRKSAYSKNELLARRDALIRFLEMNWPELKLGLKKARGPRGLVRPFRRAMKPRGTTAEPEFMIRPHDFVKEAWEFSQSKWYNGNPRQLAGALAGLPKLSWKRSFDLCSASPSLQAMDPRAYRDMLQRKFPNRFRELLSVKSDKEIVSILQQSRTRNTAYGFLLSNPRLVTHYFRLGQPGVWR